MALESELGLCDSVMVRGLENRCWKEEIKNRRKCSLKSQAKILEEPMWKGKSVFILLWREATSGNYIKEHFFIGRTIPNGLESMSTPHPREAEEARGCVGRLIFLRRKHLWVVKTSVVFTVSALFSVTES